jgi:hypothetical protein
VVHRTVSGAPGWSTVNQLLSGNNRCVRLKFTGLSGGAPDCPVSQLRQRPTVVRTINARHVASSNGQLGASDSVRCANQPRGTTVGCARYGRRSRTIHEQWLSGGAPNYPGHHSTEDKIGFPCWPPNGS